MFQPANSTESPARRKSRGWLRELIRWGILLATVLGMGYHVRAAWLQLQGQSWAEAGIRYAPAQTAMAFGLYVAAVGLSGLGFALALRVMTPPGPPRASIPWAIGTYVISQMGKYIPGKIMVLFIRWYYLRGQAPGAVTLAATFYETLSIMGMGALAAAAVFTVADLPESFLTKARPFLWTAWPLMLGFCLPIIPPLFSLVAARIVRSTMPHHDATQVIRPMPASVAAFICLLMLGNWTLQGVSYYAVWQSLLVQPPGWELLPLLIACVALANVGGFLSMLPGHLGFRELVLIETLQPVVGQVPALAAAVCFRLITLSAEGLLALAFYGTMRPLQSAARAEGEPR